MKVKELIKALKVCDQNAEVVVTFSADFGEVKIDLKVDTVGEHTGKKTFNIFVENEIYRTK